MDAELLLVFQDRSTARVADVSSVLVRDLIVWMFLCRRSWSTLEYTEKFVLARECLSGLDLDEDLDDQIYQFAMASNWGAANWS
jgi:hypothetical protein